jgi:large subunit ribosomal protein L47
LRLKSFEDLHKLWYVLLKERNMLLSQKNVIDEEGKKAYQLAIGPRLKKVKLSMARLKTVLGERVKEAKLIETHRLRVQRKEKLERLAIEAERRKQSAQGASSSASASASASPSGTVTTAHVESPGSVSTPGSSSSSVSSV